jgi:hypothetical protein
LAGDRLFGATNCGLISSDPASWLGKGKPACICEYEFGWRIAEGRSSGRSNEKMCSMLYIDGKDAFFNLSPLSVHLVP